MSQYVTKTLDQTNTFHLEEAAEQIAQGEAIIFYFNGVYAFLGDADQTQPADQIFAVKKRPLSRNLALACAPQYLTEFIDLSHPLFTRLPLTKIIHLYHDLHAIGLVFPANPTSAPLNLTRAGTILNVWSNYPPLLQLQEACRRRGVRAFSGASANMSDQPTYTTLAQVQTQFDGQVSLILDQTPHTPAHRQKSTTLVNLTTSTPTLFREGNVPASEITAAFRAHNLGPLTISPQLKKL